MSKYTKLNHTLTYHLITDISKYVHTPTDAYMYIRMYYIYMHTYTRIHACRAPTVNAAPCVVASGNSKAVESAYLYTPASNAQKPAWHNSLCYNAF